MGTTKKTTKTEPTEAEPQTPAAAEPDPAAETAEAPGAAGDRFRAAVLAVHDGASGEHIEQILMGA